VAAALTLVTIIAHTFNYKRDFYIPVGQVESSENQRTSLLAAQA